MNTDELAEQIADMQIELENLRRFKRIMVRFIECPSMDDLRALGMSREDIFAFWIDWHRIEEQVEKAKALLESMKDE